MSAEELWGWRLYIKTGRKLGWESKEHAEVVDLGCTAGLQPDREPGAPRHVQIKHQGNVVNQTTSPSSITMISQAE